MMRSVLLFMFLMAMWLLLSGHYTALITGFGVVSVGFAVMMSARMGGTDEEGLPLHMMARLPAYILWLLKEILLSNIATAKMILSNRYDPE